MNPSFAAEKTLGKLAKWLRILGFDTSYESDFSNSTAWELAEAERIFLTRTHRRRDKTSSSNLIFIKSDHLFEQLKEVIQELALEPEDTRPFSRCLQCNMPIVSVEKNDLKGQVPDYIFETHDHFHQCPQCDRIFWPGSHTHRSLEKIRHLFDIK